MLGETNGLVSGVGERTVSVLSNDEHRKEQLHVEVAKNMPPLSNTTLLSQQTREEMGLGDSRLSSAIDNDQDSKSAEVSSPVPEDLVTGEHRNLAESQLSISLQNVDNVQYFGDVSIGNPPQNLKIMFDTGSSDTWVQGVGCVNCEQLRSSIDNDASTSAVNMGRNFTNRYDSGSVAGQVFKDSLAIDGLAVNGVEMGLVRDQEQHIRGFRADGVIGLAFPSISTIHNTSPSRHPTFVELLGEQRGRVGEIFSVYLTPTPNQPGSELTFGGYNLDLVRRTRQSPGSNRSSSTPETRRTRKRSRLRPALRGSETSTSSTVLSSEHAGRTQGEDTSKSGESRGGTNWTHSDAKYGHRIAADSSTPVDIEEMDEPVIVWAPVVQYHGSLSYWTIQISGWRTERRPSTDGGSDTDRYQNGKGREVGRAYACPQGCKAIVDTGSSLLLPPRGHFSVLMENIVGGRPDCKEREGIVSCSRCSPDDFPDLVISIVSSSRVLQGQSSPDRFDEQSLDVSQDFRLRPSDYLVPRSNRCELLIGPGHADDIWTLGDVFIKTYMTIFDVANLRVGFVCPDNGRCLGGAGPTLRTPHRLCTLFDLLPAADGGTHGRHGNSPSACELSPIPSMMYVLLVGLALVAGTVSFPRGIRKQHGQS